MSITVAGTTFANWNEDFSARSTIVTFERTTGRRRFVGTSSDTKDVQVALTGSQEIVTDPDGNQIFVVNEPDEYPNFDKLYCIRAPSEYISNTQESITAEYGMFDFSVFAVDPLERVLMQERGQSSTRYQVVTIGEDATFDNGGAAGDTVGKTFVIPRTQQDKVFTLRDQPVVNESFFNGYYNTVNDATWRGVAAEQALFVGWDYDRSITNLGQVLWVVSVTIRIRDVSWNKEYRPDVAPASATDFNSQFKKLHPTPYTTADFSALIPDTV